MRVPHPVSSLPGLHRGLGSLEMDHSKVEAVNSWPVPETRKQLQRFLGYANFYQCFIRNYSSVAAPLTVMTSPKSPFRWSHTADTAFQTLKNHFSPVSILQVPDNERQFVVEVDASDVGVGAVLSQRAAGDQKFHSCAFFLSASLTCRKKLRHRQSGASGCLFWFGLITRTYNTSEVLKDRTPDKLDGPSFSLGSTSPSP